MRRLLLRRRRRQGQLLPLLDVLLQPLRRRLRTEEGEEGEKSAEVLQEGELSRHAPQIRRHLSRVKSNKQQKLDLILISNDIFRRSTDSSGSSHGGDSQTHLFLFPNFKAKDLTAAAAVTVTAAEAREQQQQQQQGELSSFSSPPHTSSATAPPPMAAAAAAVVADPAIMVRTATIDHAGLTSFRYFDFDFLPLVHSPCAKCTIYII